MTAIPSAPPTTMPLDEAGRLAEARVLGDLVDTLLAEGFLDAQPLDRAAPDTLPAELAWPSGADCLRWWTAREAGQAVLIPVRAAILPPQRHVGAAGVFAVRYRSDGRVEQWRRLTPDELLDRVVAHCLDAQQRQMPGVENVRRMLATTLWQTRQSIAEMAPLGSPLALSTAAGFQALERRAALRDRPFHPLAKAKQGLDEEGHRRYAAEFDRPIRMRWLAMRRDCLMAGSGAEAPGAPEPMALLLGEAERGALEAEMAQRDLAREAYLALPVHPWQLAHGLPRHLAGMLEAGEGVVLDTAAGDFQATSSLRSLAPLDGGRYYLKLPMAVFSLGAARYLPAVKLINGEQGQTMLEQARPLDPVLQTRLHFCDERRWWSYLPQGSGLFDDPPRHLGAMVREYPAALLEDPAVRLLPMAALGVPLDHAEHPFDDWRRQRGLPEGAEAIVTLFGEVCTTFFDIVLRLYRLGLMPEIHGQNAVLVWRDGQLDGLLLRDHDSVRLHLPWLDRHAIDDPHYRIRPGYSNSLYNDSPSDLLFYLQTLGIQVNLLAIIETLAQHYAPRHGLTEASLWSEMRIRLEERIAALPFDDEQRHTLDEVLFAAPRWPLKCVLGPLFEQQGVPGSMPSGKSSLPNPFQGEALAGRGVSEACVVDAEPV